MITTLRHALYLALAYLWSAPLRTAILVAGTTVALFLPVFTFTAADRLEDGLMARARKTPVLIGAKGNEFDLTMASLYWRGRVRDTIPWRTRTKVTDRDYGLAIPLVVGHSAAGRPVVGTSPEYYELRGLQPSQGRLPALLGEVVAGAEVARQLRLEVGSTLRSDLTNLYNIAGAYPLLLKVVGILDRQGSADDEAFFTDLHTCWVLDGSLHAHAKVTDDSAIGGSANNLEANPGIFLFTEVTDRNRGSFHLHGSPDDMPVTAILAVPRDRKAHDELLGDFVLEDDLRAVQPVEVINTVLGIVLRLRDALSAYFALVAVSTAAFFVLVLSLSLRLRRDELRLMARMGSSRLTVMAMVLAEILAILGLSAAGTLSLTALALTLLERFLTS